MLAKLPEAKDIADSMRTVPYIVSIMNEIALLVDNFIDSIAFYFNAILHSMIFSQ